MKKKRHAKRPAAERPNQAWFQRGGKGGPGRPKGMPNIATREHRRFCREFLESPEYRESAMWRVLAGRAPHLETLMAHYAYGQPKQVMEIIPRSTTFVLTDGSEPAPRIVEAPGP